jgi:poly-gamma-glutamate capsule biosynthesis protein CapA/YwtB (metallophosphatase superfamily)
MRLRVAVVLWLLIWATGCTPVASTRGAGDDSEAPSPSPVAGPASAEPAPPPPDPEVRLAFVGDILLGGGIDWVLRQRGADYPWVHAAPILQEADLAVGNLETAVARGGQPVPNKQFTFRSRPETLHGASQAGVDVFSLANNHSLDYGREALVETIRHVREYGIYPVGAGADAAEAARPVQVEVNGLTIAVLGFSRVIPEVGWVAGQNHPGVNPGWDPTPTVAAVKEAKAQADVVVAYIHWGEELQDQPRSADQELAQQLLDAGAALVVGHHPHLLQGIQWKGNGLVAYSLGNFIFTSGSNPVTSDTGILEVVVRREGVKSAKFTPLVIKEGQPRPADAGARKRIFERLNRLSRPWQTSVAEDGTLTRAGAP